MQSIEKPTFFHFGGRFQMSELRPNTGSGTEPRKTPAGTKAPWTEPTVTDLPRLTDLTLITGEGIPGEGGTGGGGSTVIF